jgi:hypothetical protein
MARRFERPLSGGTVAATFPDCCVSCGGPRAAEGTLTLEPPASAAPRRRRRGAPRRIVLKAPLCARCFRADQVSFLVSLGAYAAGGVAIAVTVFVALVILDLRFLGIFTGERTANGQEPVMVLLLLAAIAGLLGGLVVEALARIVLLPFMGRVFFHAPFWMSQMLGNTDHVAGVTAGLTPDGQRVWLRLSNDEVADAFARLNR